MQISTTKSVLFCVLLTLLKINSAQADQVIINNNGGGNQQAAPNPCENNAPPGMPPGHYVKKNRDGSIDEVYTTGEKQPYIIDNNCGQPQQPIIVQPFIQPNYPVKKP